MHVPYGSIVRSFSLSAYRIHSIALPELSTKWPLCCLLHIVISHVRASFDQFDASSERETVNAQVNNCVTHCALCDTLCFVCVAS